MTDKITDHDRIWLEPAGAPDRCWCSDNQWGDEGIEYVRADLALSLHSAQAGEVEVVAWRYKDWFPETIPFADKEWGFSESGPDHDRREFHWEPLITLSSHLSVIAAPPQPVVTDEMVQKIVYALSMHKGLRVTVAQLDWLEPALFEALTAALSVKPKSGENA